jgi:hypothetical protein
LEIKIHSGYSGFFINYKKMGMYNIELNIDAQYLNGLLAFLTNIGEGQEIVRVAKRKKKGVTQPPFELLAQLPPDDPLRQWVKPLRQSLHADDFIKPHFKTGVNRARLDALFLQLNIEQPIETLLADLKA